MKGAEMLVNRAGVDDRFHWSADLQVRIMSMSGPGGPRSGKTTSSAMQLMRRRIVARHAGHAVARRDHHGEIVGVRLLAEPLLGELGDGAALLHAVERVLQLGAQLGIVLRYRGRPVGARVLELE